MKNKFIKIYNDNFLGNFKIINKSEKTWKVEKLHNNGTKSGIKLNINPEILKIVKLERTESSGIIFNYKDKYLFVKQNDGTYSYPKGKIDKGETLKDAAVREVEEEISVKFPKSLLPKKYHTLKWFKEFKYKKYNYFIYKLNDSEFVKYFGKYTLPKEDLQEQEILWGGFMNYNELQEKLNEKFLPILKHL